MDEKPPPRPTVEIQSYDQPPHASSSKRERAASLSVARSPSVLSASFANPFTDPTPNHAPTHQSSHSLSIPAPQSGPISYSNSLSVNPYSKSLALGRTRTLPAPEHDKSLSRTSTVPITLKEEGDARERFMNGLGHDINLDEDEEELLSGEEDEVEDGLMGRSTGFQKPDRKEMIWMLSSLGGVLVISLAAGLTTIFDWVF